MKTRAILIAVIALLASCADTDCKEHEMSNGALCLVCTSTDFGGSEGAMQRRADVDCAAPSNSPDRPR